MELLCEEDSCLLEDDKLHLTDEQTPLLRLYTFFLLMFQSVFQVSDNAMNGLLLFFSMFFSTLSTIAMIPKAFILNIPKKRTICSKCSWIHQKFFEKICLLSFLPFFI